MSDLNRGRADRIEQPGDTPRLVVKVTWRQDSPKGPQLVSETYGPWVAQADQSHMEAIRQSMDAWRGVNGDWVECLISIVQPPYYYSVPETAADSGEAGGE